MVAQRERGSTASAGLPVLVGLAAVVFSALYLISDVIELVQGGFSTSQLALTYAAEAAIPFFVVGLYAVQRPRIEAWGLAGALGYAYTFVFFTGTVLFALVDHTTTWDALADRLGAWVDVHGALMVVTGLAFGLAVVRARVLPRWTGVALMAGVVLVAVSSGMPDDVQTAAAGIRDVAFGGMGVSLLVSWRKTSAEARGSWIADEVERSLPSVPADTALWSQFRSDGRSRT